MPRPKSTGQDSRLVLGSGETGFKTGDFYLSGDKLFYISNITRNGATVFINQPSAQGDLVIGYRQGEYEDAPKTTGEAWVVGQALYWDNATKKFTTTAGSLKKVAQVGEPAIAGATIGVVVLTD